MISNETVQNVASSVFPKEVIPIPEGILKRLNFAAFTGTSPHDWTN